MTALTAIALEITDALLARDAQPRDIAFIERFLAREFQRGVEAAIAIADNLYAQRQGGPPESSAEQNGYVTAMREVVAAIRALSPAAPTSTQADPWRLDLGTVSDGWHFHELHEYGWDGPIQVLRCALEKTGVQPYEFIDGIGENPAAALASAIAAVEHAK